MSIDQPPPGPPPPEDPSAHRDRLSKKLLDMRLQPKVAMYPEILEELNDLAASIQQIEDDGLSLMERALDEVAKQIDKLP